MWDCEECGCQNIAGTIDECPMCHAPRQSDDQDVTVESGQPAEDSSSAAAGSQPESGPQPSEDTSAAAPPSRKSSKSSKDDGKDWGEDA